MAWRSEGKDKDVPSVTYFYGRTMLVPLVDDAGAKVLAFVKVTHAAKLGPSHYVGVGKVLSYVPLTAGASIPVDAEAYLEPGHELGDTAVEYLRFIDKRGVPWKIAGYRQPPEGFEKHVVAWTNEYGAEQMTREAETLDLVKKEIKGVEEAYVRNTPAITEATLLSDDEGPVVFVDANGLEGAFYAHAVHTEGKSSFFAVRASPFSTEVVGPAASLAQLQGDVSAYRDDVARASLALSTTAPSSTAANLAGLSVADDTPPSATSIAPTEPPAEAKSSSRWPSWTPFAFVGVMAYAAYKFDQSRGV